jgi:molecular chaperone DnaJ
VSVDEYYKRLNLPRTASASDVKRAYRRLRAKYHPDRNKGRESTVEPVFKRIQEAFEILTGERKAPVRSPAEASNENREKETPSRARRSSPPMRGSNCLIELFVPLEIAIHGGEVEASYPMTGPCQQCAESDSPCASCEGRSQTYRKSEVIKVPARAWDGQRLVVEGGGNAGSGGGPPGDAIFSVVIVCDSAFRRNGLNLARDIQVDFVLATLGGNLDIPILGQTLRVKIPPNAHAGTTIRLAGQGIPQRSGSHGDLTLHLVLTMPAAASHLSDNDRQRLREMFADAERRATDTASGASRARS